MTALRPSGRQSAGYFPTTQVSTKQGFYRPFGGVPFRTPRSPAVLLGATHVSRASIKTYEIACSIHLFNVLSSGNCIFLPEEVKVYAGITKNGRRNGKNCGKYDAASADAEGKGGAAAEKLPPGEARDALAREQRQGGKERAVGRKKVCLLYTSPSPRD